MREYITQRSNNDTKVLPFSEYVIANSTIRSSLKYLVIELDQKIDFIWLFHIGEYKVSKNY